MCRWRGGAKRCSESSHPSGVLVLWKHLNTSLLPTVGGQIEAGVCWIQTVAVISVVCGRESTIKSAKSAQTRLFNPALTLCSWTGHSWGNRLPWQLCCWRWMGFWLGRGGVTEMHVGGPCLFIALALCWECPKGSHPSKHRWKAPVKTTEHRKILSYFLRAPSRHKPLSKQKKKRVLWRSLC